MNWRACCPATGISGIDPRTLLRPVAATTDHRTVRHQAHHPDVGRRTQRAGLRREPMEPDRQSVGGVALALCQQWEGNLIRQKSSDSRDAVVGRLKSDGVVAAREHDRAQPISVETSCT